MSHLQPSAFSLPASDQLNRKGLASAFRGDWQGALCQLTMQLRIRVSPGIAIEEVVPFSRMSTEIIQAAHHQAHLSSTDPDFYLVETISRQLSSQTWRLDPIAAEF